MLHFSEEVPSGGRGRGIWWEQGAGQGDADLQAEPRSMLTHSRGVFLVSAFTCRLGVLGVL